MPEASDERGSTASRLLSESPIPSKLSDNLKAPLIHPREWFFLIEDRLVIASGILIVAFALFFAVELVTDFADQQLVPLYYIFGALIGGNFTLITIVVSVSQLIISQQLGSPGDLRQQIEDANEYREAAEDQTGDIVAPVMPTDFLQFLVGQTDVHVNRVNDQLDTISDPEAREDLDEFLSGIAAHVEQTNTLVAQSEVGIFEALSVTLQTNYSKDIYQIRKFRIDYHDQLPEEVEDSLHDLMVQFKQIDIARQYLKTLYMEDELAKVSRMLLYTGFPAVMVALLMLRQFAGSTHALFAPALMSKLLPLALTIGVAPLAVLFAFVLRISVVAQRTAATTPFTTPSQEADLSLASTVKEEVNTEQSDD